MLFVNYRPDTPQDAGLTDDERVVAGTGELDAFDVDELGRDGGVEQVERHASAAEGQRIDVPAAIGQFERNVPDYKPVVARAARKAVGAAAAVQNVVARIADQRIVATAADRVLDDDATCDRVSAGNDKSGAGAAVGNMWVEV
jgi:hypothetical protein